MRAPVRVQYRVVRAFPLLIIPLILLSACRGTYAYTHLDLVQTWEEYHHIVPIYRQFHTVYLADNGSEIQDLHRREVAACQINYAVDKRDTIDPSTNLWQASVTLDDLCNAMDSAYAYWAEKHHLPYDNQLYAAPPDQVFQQSDLELQMLWKELLHPRQVMTCPTPVTTSPC